MVNSRWPFKYLTFDHDGFLRRRLFAWLGNVGAWLLGDFICRLHCRCETVELQRHLVTFLHEFIQELRFILPEAHQCLTNLPEVSPIHNYLFGSLSLFRIVVLRIQQSNRHWHSHLRFQCLLLGADLRFILLQSHPHFVFLFFTVLSLQVRMFQLVLVCLIFLRGYYAQQEGLVA